MHDTSRFCHNAVRIYYSAAIVMGEPHDPRYLVMDCISFVIHLLRHLYCDILYRDTGYFRLFELPEARFVPKHDLHHLNSKHHFLAMQYFDS